MNLNPSSAATNKAAEAALKEFLRSTGAMHVTRNFWITDSDVTLEIYPAHGSIHLAFIGVNHESRRQGRASTVLGQLATVADKHGVPVDLSVQPSGRGGLAKRELFNWYQRKGFKRQNYPNSDKQSDRMIRNPIR